MSRRPSVSVLALVAGLGLTALTACSPEPAEAPDEAAMITPDTAAPNATISDSDGPAAPAESAPPADAAAVDPGAAAPLPGDTGSCDANPVQELVGRVADDSVLEQARGAANADTARILRPGQAVTMEYNGARLNLQVDDEGVIQAVRCG